MLFTSINCFGICLYVKAVGMLLWSEFRVIQKPQGMPLSLLSSIIHEVPDFRSLEHDAVRLSPETRTIVEAVQTIVGPRFLARGVDAIRISKQQRNGRGMSGN